MYQHHTIFREKFELQSMPVRHEQVAGHDTDSLTPGHVATSHQTHALRKASRPRARDVTEETNPLTPTLSIEDVSDHRPSPRRECQISLGEQLANLAISYPALAPSTSPLLSPNFPLPSVQAAESTTLRAPITVRDLLNATSRPSPSPELASAKSLRPFHSY